MGCDEDDKKDERVWDGEVLLPYNMDDFDDNPYAELKDLLQRLPETSSAPMLSCSGKATSYINVQPVTSMSRKNSEIVLVENSGTKEVYDKDKNSDLGDNMAKEVANKYSDLNECVAREVVNKNSDSDIDEYVAKDREVSNKNSDLGMSMAMKVVNKNSDNTATKPEDPPVMNNLLNEIFESCVLESEPTEASNDTLANIVKSIGIIDSLELDLDVPTDTNSEPGHETTKNIAPEVEHEKAELETINNMPTKAAEEAGTSEGQQCENIKGAAVSMSLETVDISDNSEEGEEEAASPTLLNFRSICENIIQVHTSDMLTLRPGVYVSDPIIDMYLDYLHRKVSPALQQDIFIFPTLFYQMLSTTGTRMKPPVNIFDKGCKYDKTMTWQFWSRR